MLLDYELAISCALAALAILRIVHLRRRWLRVREQLRSIKNPIDASRESAPASRASTRSPHDRGNESADLFYDRLIVLLLILAVLWFGGRIWIGA